jgi:hypothetical protein
MYRVIYWFNGEQRFTAKTTKEDAVNTAKHFNGTVVKEVGKYNDLVSLPIKKRIMKDKLEEKLAYSERDNNG